ncbi:hypothetical protein ACP70R_018361 [Stipagrostis hirtigluma subsp. patula]
MSLRRFVYLVMGGPGTYDLRRIDMSRFFFTNEHGQRHDHLPHPPPSQLEEDDLPEPATTFVSPTGGHMDFMLLAGGGGESNMVVATDETCRATLHDPEAGSNFALPKLSSPKLMAAAVTVDGGLYVLQTVDRFARISPENCFDCLVRRGSGLFRRLQLETPTPPGDDPAQDDEWFCRPLPPPPFVDGGGGRWSRRERLVDSYAVVGGGDRGAGQGPHIWVSTPDQGTHSFDVARRAWSKAGDWSLPLRGHAQFVPEHGLWFGHSGNNDDYDDRDFCKHDLGHVCAADLTATPPTLHAVWTDPTPPEGRMEASYLVHLGRSRFCLARTLETCSPEDGYQDIMVVSGIEVQRCDDDGGKLRMVKHRSQRYDLDCEGEGFAECQEHSAYRLFPIVHDMAAK